MGYEFDKEGISDGVYDISDMDYLLVNYKTDNGLINEFKQRHPNGYMCSSYEVDDVYLLSEKPIKMVAIDNKTRQNFEGHGTLTVIDNCPRRIIIIGQND